MRANVGAGAPEAAHAGLTVKGSLKLALRDRGGRYGPGGGGYLMCVLPRLMNSAARWR